ncbi:MAG: alcohol dehydrogenase [Alphaproteobacteria bacterium RIFCSPHIGHO2_12_FULL_63_12]|nr:MAG: alcohol dehydrogenase [Alphaproteobacteria bacterium RIFCSPHIGHO2_12_FULL_63_12]
MKAAAIRILFASSFVSLTACGAPTAPSIDDAVLRAFNAAPAPTGVDAAAIINADATPGEWLTHGRTYDEQRYSPLGAINTDNVKDLGLAWSFDLGVSRGIETTPIVHDGVMYVTGSWNIVHALDARTGAEIWSFDPQVDRSRASVMCCDIVNRGVAIWDGKIFTGTIDGRLIALDAKSGAKLWDVLTVDLTKPYSITGAPRIVKGKVLIGNGGAEFGVRGYLSAYDADSGDMLWRFHTVPGNPADGFENAAMEMAAKTWNGEWWKLGGGGTVWDSMAYDPALDLLYIGVGNGSPWNQRLRSPGGGDNLFLSSIVALKPDTGAYVWHYQTTPGETWDYTATQHIILADIEIDGAPRKVLMQAPKNGFFYVLDRATGELLSAKNFAPVTWATGVDMKTGRPIENPAARWPGSAPSFQLPGPLGAHNWHPMSFSPRTGLVYIPASEIPFAFADQPDFKVKKSGWNTGAEFLAGSLPTDEATHKALRAMMKGRLLAWDPAKQEARWSVEHFGPWNGGVLSTAGDVVFQGTSDAHFAAYDAASGGKLWDYFTQTGVVAAPIAYELDGEEYVTVASGWGGAYALIAGGIIPTGSEAKVGRVLTFRLGSSGELPQIAPPAQAKAAPPPSTASAETIAAGALAYAANCTVCHGEHAMSSGLTPNLRYSPLLADAALWKSVVLDGARKELGMMSFNGILDEAGAEAIRAYVINEANSNRDAAYYEAIAGTEKKP